MKTNNPIKRDKALISFSKDHHFGLLLVWKIRQGLKKCVDANRISNYVLYFFNEDLSLHFKDEEQNLFNQLPADDLLRKKAEKEHQSIYTIIDNIKNNKNDETILNRLADELETHIRFEERELFNHLQEHANPGWIKCIDRVSNDSRTIDDNWQDQFWK